MRSEKRNRFLAILLALVLLATVPAVYLRVQIAGGQLTSGDLAGLMDYNNSYLDCTGTVITDSHTPVPEIMGNLIGFDNYVDNALSSKYKDQLGPETFNRITGIQSLKELKGSQLETTLLPVSSQQALAETFSDYNGAIFAYNYVTGQVYTALSLPSVAHFSDTIPDGSLYNKVLKGTYTPGSTMKIVAVLCALEQSGIDLDSFRFSCTGSVELPDGNKITCGYAHGKNLTITDAIGKSCNCFITQLASQFDVTQACESLQRLGFSTQQQKVPQQYVGTLRRSSSSTVFADPNVFADRWGFAGQGATVASCIDMTMIAAAIAGGGQAAEPYIVEQVTDLDTGDVSREGKTVMRQLISENVASRADSCWTAACEKYYTFTCDAISYAKTGTIEYDDGTTSRSLLGVMKQYNTAFFVYVEGLPGGDKLCSTIAGVLAEELAKVN